MTTPAHVFLTRFNLPSEGVESLIRAREGWLRERFLPRLPDDVLVVLAGRTPPDVEWRVDPGWGAR